MDGNTPFVATAPPPKNGKVSRGNAPFRLAGVDGPVEIPESQWYINTKHRPRRVMQEPLSSEAQRIHACLELATMGYSQELAVTMENGKKRPLLSVDIARQTGLKRPNVDRGIRELEENGLAERRALNPDIPLQKGNIGIYSWAVPREPESPIVITRDNNPASWQPPGWLDPTSTIYKTLRRFRINLSPDFVPARDYIDEVEKSAAAYQSSEDCLVALLRLSGAPKRLSGAGSNGVDPSLYERNRKELKEEEVGRSVVVVADEEDQPTDRPHLEVIVLDAVLPALPSDPVAPEIREIQAVVEEVAVPVLGEAPSLQEYAEIHRRLQGASAAQYKARLLAKKNNGGLKSVRILVHLADDCAKSKDSWKPPPNEQDERNARIQRIAELTQVWESKFK